jgi:hypothetical protein
MGFIDQVGSRGEMEFTVNSHGQEECSLPEGHVYGNEMHDLVPV